MKHFYLLFLLASLNASGQCHSSRSRCATKKTTSQKTPRTANRYTMLGGGYELSLPAGAFRNGMGTAHSLFAQAGVPLRFISPRLLLGAEASYGTYATEGFTIDYQQGANKINTTVNYFSAVAQMGLMTQYVLCDKGRVQPYLSARSGYANFTSHFMVEDPSDAESCKLLDRGSLQSDATLYWGYGAGLRIAMGKRRREAIDVSVQRTRGGKLDYINVDKLQHQSAPMTVTDGAKPVAVNFINASTNEMHQHTFAEVFRNPMDMVQVRVAYVTKLFRNR